MKKLVSLLLTLTMLLGAGALPTALAEEPPEITWLLEVGTTADENNPVLDAIEEAIGVRVRVIQVSPGDLDAKLNTLIASRQLPDLFTAKNADAVQFLSEGMLMPIEGFLSGHGQNITRELNDYIERSPVNNVDGHTYMICGYGENYAENLAVRVDWLKNLGMEMPTDLDSLYDVLYAFTYNDPDGNGQNDTIGIVLTMAQAFQWDVLFGAFGIAYDKPYLLEDGTVTTYMNSPDYLAAIAYLRKLYQAGVMDREFATMPAMTAHERLWTGRCGVYGFRSVGITNNWYPGRYTFDVPEDPAEVFGYTDITGPNGDHGSTKRFRTLEKGFVVSSTCKHPEAVIKLLDFLATEEGDELTYLGVEGLMYEWIDEESGKYRRLGEYTDDALHRAKGGFSYWNALIANHTELRTMNRLTQDAQAFACENPIEWPYIFSALEADAEYGITLKEIEKEALAQLIVTNGDVEAEYAGFIARWQEEGGLDWEAEATEAYHAQAN